MLLFLSFFIKVVNVFTDIRTNLPEEAIEQLDRALRLYNFFNAQLS